MSFEGKTIVPDYFETIYLDHIDQIISITT